MRLIIFCTKCMSELMYRKIFCSSETCQTIMGKASCPHDFTHGIVVCRILQTFLSIFNHYTQNALCNLICHLISRIRNKITFQRMHHDIYDSTCNLIFWKRIGKNRIHDRKLRAVQAGADSSLFPCFFVCQNCGIACFTSCCRNRKYASYRCRSGKCDFTTPDLLQRPVRVCHTMGDRLCCINRTSTAYCKKKIRTELNCFLNAFLCICHPGIWLYSAKFLISKSFFFQCFFYLRKKSAFLYTSTAIYDKYTASAPFLNFFPNFCLCVFSK